MLIVVIIIPFIGTKAGSVDAGVGAIAGVDVSFVVAAGEGSMVVGGTETEGGTVFLSLDIANNEKPGVLDPKYSDALSSLIFEVGKAFQLLSQYLLKVLPVSRFLEK